MIDSFFTLLRRTIVGIVALVFVFTITYIPQPHTNVAEAQWAVTEVGPVGASTFANTGVNISVELITSTLNAIAWDVAKRMLSNMLDSTIDWINSGFEGSPAFVQDLEGFLLQAADEVVAEYLIELDDRFSFICEPFRLDVRLALAINYDAERERDQGQCTVSDMFNNVQDFQDFITGDFERGGWDAWFELVRNPSQTPYGAALEAQVEARARIVNAKGQELTYTGWGNGFLSGKLCNEAEGPQNQQVCQIVKPGKVISEQLNKALGRGEDTLVEADQINEVVAALMGQIANRAITGAAGLLGLSGNSGYTPYSRGSFAAEVQGGGVTTTGGINTGSTLNGPITVDPLDAASVPLTNRLSSSLSAQQAVLSQIDSYVRQFQIIANSSASSEFAVGQAQSAIFEAETLRNQISSQLGSATTIVTRYVQLETEYATASSERQGQIRLEQSQLIQDYSALGLPGESQITATLARWDAIITMSNPTNPMIDNCDMVQFDPDCRNGIQP